VIENILLSILICIILLFIVDTTLTVLLYLSNKNLKTEIKLLKQQNKNQSLNDENDIRSRYDALMQTRYGQLNLRNISFENLPSAANVAALRQKDTK
jgi:hypothetical protein